MFGVSAIASAQWIQGQASLAVHNAPLDEVRRMAIKNAIADASFTSGSLITAQDVVIDGLLVSSKAEVHTTGRIQRVEILQETLEENQLTVVIRANITPLFQCESDKYARSVVVSQLMLLNPRQAAHGDIYDFGAQISQRFAQQLQRQPGSLDVLLYNKAFMQQTRPVTLLPRQLNEKAALLARELGKQFIIFGQIRDISLFEQVNTSKTRNNTALRRNFTLDIYVIDAFRQSVLLQGSYHSEADWTFSPANAVDTSNSLFWRSDFGRVALNTVNSAVSDISHAIACEKTVTQVIDHVPDGVVIGMGEKEGVQVGDEFALVKYQTLKRTALTGLTLTRPLPQFTFKVTNINAHVAILQGTTQHALAAANLYDLIAPSTIKTSKKAVTGPD